MVTKNKEKKSNFKAIIKDAKKSSVVATGEKFIDVEVEVFDETNKKIDTIKLGYTYDTPQEEIEADLKKHLLVREAEKEQKEKQEKEEKEEKEVDDKIKNLKNKEIN